MNNETREARIATIKERFANYYRGVGIREAEDFEWLIQEHDTLRAQVEALEKELSEQARVNGMGGERELKLMAQVETLRAEADRLTQQLNFNSDLRTSSEEKHWTARRELESQAAAMRKVVDAAMILRNSGYDGPFMGEPVAELFKALAETETSDAGTALLKELENLRQQAETLRDEREFEREMKREAQSDARDLREKLKDAVETLARIHNGPDMSAQWSADRAKECLARIGGGK